MQPAQLPSPTSRGLLGPGCWRRTPPLGLVSRSLYPKRTAVKLCLMSGAALVYAGWAAGRVHRPAFGIAAWADAERVLPRAAASEPGRWSTTRTPYAAELMDRLGPEDPTQRIVFMKGAQVGAPLDVDTPIPTPDGWTTMGAVQPGAMVFSADGSPVEVVGTSPVFVGRPCFEVVFSDGATIVADSEHRWTVRDAFPGHAGKRNGVAGRQRTLTTAELAESLHHGGRNRYSIPVAG